MATMVPGITPQKSNSTSSNSDAALAAYKTKQQSKSSTATRATVASLITCCAGQELMDGFPANEFTADDCDNDSFVNPGSLGGSSHSGGGGSARKPPRRKSGSYNNTNNNNGGDGFGSAIKKQQQRNRFTSSPLIERDSSLVKQESGLLSLLSSGTFVETSPKRGRGNGEGSSNIHDHSAPSTTTNNNNNYTQPISLRRNQTPPTPSLVTSHHTPPRSARRMKLQQQQQQYSPNDRQATTTTSASPAMELSMARQSANATMSATPYQRSRSFPHSTNNNNMTTPSSPVRTMVAQTVAAMSLESPTKKARQDNDNNDDNESCNTATTSKGVRSLPSSILQQPSLSIEGTYSAAETLPPPTPPPQLHSSSFSSCHHREDVALEQPKGIVTWQYYKEATENNQQEGHVHSNSTPSLLWDTAVSSSINEELHMTYQFPRLYLQNPTELDPTAVKQAWWYKLQSGMESTLGHVRVASVQQSLISNGQPPQQHRGSDASIGSNKSFKKTLSFGSSPKLTTKKSSSANTTTTTSRNGEFSPTVQPTDVWSEPHASSMKIRGPTYTKDNVKIPSEESLFCILGVDNFIKEEGSSEDGCCRSGTSCFRERWRSVCEDVGVESVPFLLVFNFIVPWGNFQFYLIRPDADNGPFSTHHADRPSEKAWKAFLEGDTEYRNTVLKFIPRIIAGPWVVKKMVGSTPAIIGQKLPVTYAGSVEENYLEVSLDVTQGPAFGNTIANTVVGKADVVTVDLGFVLEGQDADGTLPEQMLGLVRLHHFDMKKAFTHAKWKEELKQRMQN